MSGEDGSLLCKRPWVPEEKGREAPGCPGKQTQPQGEGAADRAGDAR